MTRNELENEYFEWLFNKVCADRYSEEISFRKLLAHLHRTEFVYSISMDKNRASDGVDLRYRYSCECNKSFSLRDEYIVSDFMNKPCSVLEMMIALAVRCEESIMDDPAKGDRTTQWFWGMVVSLGLGSMTDDVYDRRIVDDIVTCFLERKYKSDGRGGLFTIRNCREDMRKKEIWYQLCHYLNTIL